MIVVDASVLVKILTGEPGAEQALARLLRDDERIAPDWIRLEIASALAKKVLRGELNVAAMAERNETVQTYLTDQFQTFDLIQDAAILAIDIDHAFYDCLYLALARRENCVVVTADKKFAVAANRAGYGDVELLA